MGLSAYTSKGLLDHLFNNLDFPTVLTGYLALFTSDAGLRDNNNLLWTEVVGGGYARQVVSFGAWANFEVQNDVDVNFPQATAVWGNITHGAMMDQLAAPGNVLTWGPLTVARNIQIDDELDFLVSSIVIPFDKN